VEGRSQDSCVCCVGGGGGGCNKGTNNQSEATNFIIFHYFLNFFQ
jgi:hypothetical protein